MNWADVALDRIGAGQPTALVTVLAADGSTPRAAGTRMLVGSDWAGGTIGGGALEWRATDQARRLLAQDERDYAVQDYPLGPFLRQCCGGWVRLLFERLDRESEAWLVGAGAGFRDGRAFALETEFGPRRLFHRVRFEDDQWPGLIGASDIRLIPRSATAPRRATPQPGDRIIEQVGARRPTVVVFGAGHVGLAIAHAFAPLPFRLTLLDIRPEAAAPDTQVATEAEIIARARAGSDFLLIMTHSHDLDYELTKAALAGPSPHIGLIGSATKRARFLSRLRDDGVAEAELARLHCPIGLPDLRNKAPEIIAVSVAADLLQRIEGA